MTHVNSDLNLQNSQNSADYYFKIPNGNVSENTNETKNTANNNTGNVFVFKNDETENNTDTYNNNSITKMDENGDFADDGKIKFGEKVKSFFKGLVSPITSLFSSPENFIKGAAIMAGCAALCWVTGGAAAPLLVTGGLIGGGIQLAKGIDKATSAKTDDEAREAWENIGAGSGIVAASVIGSKAALKAGGATEAELSNMGHIRATIKCVSDTPEALTNSISNIGTKFSGLFAGKGLKGIKGRSGAKGTAEPTGTGEPTGTAEPTGTGEPTGNNGTSASGNNGVTSSNEAAGANNTPSNNRAAGKRGVKGKSGSRRTAESTGTSEPTGNNGTSASGNNRATGTKNSKGAKGSKKQASVSDNNGITPPESNRTAPSAKKPYEAPEIEIKKYDFQEEIWSNESQANAVKLSREFQNAAKPSDIRALPEHATTNGVQPEVKAPTARQIEAQTKLDASISGQPSDGNIIELTSKAEDLKSWPSSKKLGSTSTSGEVSDGSVIDLTSNAEDLKSWPSFEESAITSTSGEVSGKNGVIEFNREAKCFDKPFEADADITSTIGKDIKPAEFELTDAAKRKLYNDPEYIRLRKEIMQLDKEIEAIESGNIDASCIGTSNSPTPRMQRIINEYGENYEKWIAENIDDINASNAVADSPLIPKKSLSQRIKDFIFTDETAEQPAPVTEPVQPSNNVVNSAEANSLATSETAAEIAPQKGIFARIKDYFAGRKESRQMTQAQREFYGGKSTGEILTADDITFNGSTAMRNGENFTGEIFVNNDNGIFKIGYQDGRLTSSTQVNANFEPIQSKSYSYASRQGKLGTTNETRIITTNHVTNDVYNRTISKFDGFGHRTNVVEKALDIDFNPAERITVNYKKAQDGTFSLNEITRKNNNGTTSNMRIEKYQEGKLASTSNELTVSRDTGRTVRKIDTQYGDGGVKTGQTRNFTFIEYTDGPVNNVTSATIRKYYKPDGTLSSKVRE